MRCLLVFSAVLRCGQSPNVPSLLCLKPLRNGNTFLHVIYKSKKKTNLISILNDVFQYSKIRTRKRNAKKSIKTEKIWNPALFGIRNPVLGIRNPQGGIQNPRLSWIPLHGANKSLYFECYATMPMLADAHISSLGHLWREVYSVSSSSLRLRCFDMCLSSVKGKEIEV